MQFSACYVSRVIPLHRRLPLSSLTPLCILGKTGHYMFNEMHTAFDSLPEHRAPNRVSMSVPIILPCTDFTKTSLEFSGKTSAALVTKVCGPPSCMGGFQDFVILLEMLVCLHLNLCAKLADDYAACDYTTACIFDVGLSSSVARRLFPYIAPLRSGACVGIL